MSSFSRLLMPSASHRSKPAGRGSRALARHFSNDRPGAELLRALAADLAALSPLAEADDVAVAAVADRSHLAPPGRDVEGELRVDGVGLVLAHVVVEARTAQ